MKIVDERETKKATTTKKDHSVIETRRLKNVLIFIQTILSFVLSRKMIY